MIKRVMKAKLMETLNLVMPGTRELGGTIKKMKQQSHKPTIYSTCSIHGCQGSVMPSQMHCLLWIKKSASKPDRSPPAT